MVMQDHQQLVNDLPRTHSVGRDECEETALLASTRRLSIEQMLSEISAVTGDMESTPVLDSAATPSCQSTLLQARDWQLTDQNWSQPGVLMLGVAIDSCSGDVLSGSGHSSTSLIDACEEVHVEMVEPSVAPPLCLRDSSLHSLLTPVETQPGEHDTKLNPHAVVCDGGGVPHESKQETLLDARHTLARTESSRRRVFPEPPPPPATPLVEPSSSQRTGPPSVATRHAMFRALCP